MFSQARRNGSSFFALVLTVGHILTQCLSVAVSAAEAGDALPAQTAVVEIEPSYERLRDHTGTLVAARRSRLAFERPGKVIEVLVDEGDTVAAGEPLARLDDRHLVALRAQAEANLAESQAVLTELTRGPRSEVIAAARAEHQQQIALRESAARNLERRAQLVATRSVSREEYDEARYALDAADARVELAKQRLAELEAGTRIEQIEAQRARTTASEARLANLLHDLDDTLLRAPYGGHIATRRVDEGAVVSTGQLIFELVEANAIEAWIGLPAKSAAKVKPGAQLELIIDGEPRKATLVSLRPELDPETRTQNVRLRIERSEGLLAGSVVRIGLRQRIEMPGCWVPTQSLVPRSRGLWALYVVQGDLGGKAVVEERSVEVLENAADRSFVRGAIAAGDRYLTSGVHRVVPGQEITISD